jgi:uncharacterized membrane protein
MEPNAGSTGAEDRGGDAVARPSDGSRWIAAIGYIAFMCFFSLWRARGDRFVRAHASQAVLLFVAECAALAVAVILTGTVGRIKLAGMIVVGLFDLIAALAALMLSLTGFLKGLFGEDWKMPFLGELRERVPGFHGQEG